MYSSPIIQAPIFICCLDVHRLGNLDESLFLSAILSFSIHWIHSVSFIICLIEFALELRLYSMRMALLFILEKSQIVTNDVHCEYLLSYNIWISLICILLCAFQFNSNDETLTFDHSSFLPWKSWDISSFTWYATDSFHRVWLEIWSLVLGNGIFFPHTFICPIPWLQMFKCKMFAHNYVCRPNE